MGLIWLVAYEDDPEMVKSALRMIEYLMDKFDLVFSIDYGLITRKEAKEKGID